MKEFIVRNEVISYFILTFIISWIGILLVATQTGIPATEDDFNRLLPIAMTPYLLGPTIVSVLLTATIDGKKGIKKLISRLVNWRFRSTWYVLSALILPVLAICILFVLSRFSDDYLPDILTSENKIDLIISGLVYGIIGGGILEEIGWSGFASTKLREKHSILKTGLIVGFYWGAWHFLPTIWGSGNESGELLLSVFLPGFFFHYLGLIPFRIIMVWVLDNTNGLLGPIIMHATLTAFLFFILNISQFGKPLFIYYACLSAGLWLIVMYLIKKKEIHR
jgi:membrane protease YdiL (CAAX protease family)